MFRQGDVLVQRADIPATASLVEEGDAIVLVLGEATGHAHVAHGRDLKRYAEGYLTALDGAELRHDEHGTITLPPGTYRIVRQREYVLRARPREIGDLPWDYVED